jgi:uncharacterized protein with HEPN domain
VKDDQVYLFHIRDAIDRALNYSSAGKSAFLADSKTQDAVIRNLEVVGEAVKNLSDTLKSRHPKIPWKRVAGMRDKMIHEYFGVNPQLIWEVIEHELPVLKVEVESILEILNKKNKPQG